MLLCKKLKQKDHLLPDVAYHKLIAPQGERFGRFTSAPATSRGTAVTKWLLLYPTSPEEASPAAGHRACPTGTAILVLEGWLGLGPHSRSPSA